MKKLNILFVVIAGLFAAGIVSASIGEYWSTVSHLIPRTNDTVDIGSTAKRVRTIFTNNLTCTDCVDDTNVDWGTGANQISSTDMPDHNGHSVRDTFVHIVNRGVAEAITVTLTGGLGVSWTTGEIYDRANHTFVATDAGSGNVTNNVVNYLKWVSGTTLTLSTTDATGDEVLIAIGTIYDGNIDGYREMSLLDESLANIRRCARAVFPTRVTSGMSVHEDTDVTNPLDVTMDAGVYCKELQERITPIEIKSRNTAMVRHFHTGGVWDSDTNAQIETTNYDNGTGKTAIPSNKWVKGLFVYMNGKIGFVYPTECFNTIAEAQEGALPAMPTGLEPLPKLTAIVYQQGAANFTNAIWQDVRAGIGEQAFGGVSDHGALAGLSDDDHTQYTLADGTRAFTGTQTFNENLEMKDDKKIYLDTAKTHYMGYSTDHLELYFSGSALAVPGLYEFYSNTGADGNGNWEPYFALKTDGAAYLENTTQGANKIFKVHMTDGMVLQTSGLNAYIKADNIATTNKTFQFPNASGTFITSGNLTDITTVGTIGTGVWNGTALTSSAIGSDQVLESHLKAVNAPTDEYVLTYEATTGDFEWEVDQTGAGGSAITFDIGDDGGNDSVDVNEIATTGDTNSIFSEPTADKVLIAVGNNWPTADTATTASALVSNPTDCGANTFAQSIVASGNLTCSAIGDADVPNNITIDLATLASTVTNATFTTALTVDTGTVGLTGNIANTSVLTLGAGASSISGANTGDQDISGYMQDTDIDTFAELQSWAVGYTDNNTTYTSSDFTHDDLTGFVANEHLDWTSDLGATNIHAANYTDTNTTYLGGTNLTLAGTTFNVDDAFLLNNGDIGTGVYDFGGATSIEIPNGGPTIDGVGEIGVDTTSDQLLYYGASKRVVPYYHEKCFTIEDIADADDNVPIWSPHKAILITDVYCRTQGGTSAVITISDGTNALEAVTCDADGQADDGSITNGAFIANERMEFDTGAVTGSVDWTNFCITYTITAD